MSAAPLARSAGPVRRLVAGCILLTVVLGDNAAAQTWQVGGGWTRTDVGLYEDGDGITIGLGRVWPLGASPLGPAPLELTAALEYARRAGSQPMFFSDPATGTALGMAEVTLHCLQPTVLLGMPLPVGGLAPRLLVGAAASLKVGETWTTPSGEADREFGYQDLDLAVLAGLAVDVGPIWLEGRFWQGLTDQLIVIGASPARKGSAAEDPLQGATLPQQGQKASGLQVTAGLRF